MVLHDSKEQDSRIKFGYIEKTGKIVVALAYAGARSFHEGLAVVSIYRIGVKFYPQAVIEKSPRPGGSQIQSATTYCRPLAEAFPQIRKSEGSRSIMSSNLSVSFTGKIREASISGRPIP
jgi:hypothetical protein